MISKREYILDECCLHHASKLVNHQDQFSSSALKVIIDIEHYCHTFCASKELLKKYRKHASTLRKDNTSDSNIIIKLLFNILPHIGKLKDWEFDIHPLTNETGLPEDDKYLVRLAHASKATLITADMRLIKILDPDQEGYSSRYDIRVLTPDQAINEINFRHLKHENKT